MGSGGVLPVAKVTDESWWDCYRANSDSGAVQPADVPRSDVPSNVTSGPFGNAFVEAPAMFERSGVRVCVCV